jgi:hypothetical protein
MSTEPEDQNQMLAATYKEQVKKMIAASQFMELNEFCVNEFKIDLPGMILTQKTTIIHWLVRALIECSDLVKVVKIALPAVTEMISSLVKGQSGEPDKKICDE